MGRKRIASRGVGGEAMAVRDWRDANGAIEDGHGMPCPYECLGIRLC